MPAPTIEDYQATSFSDASDGSLETASVTWSSGDRVVVLGLTEDQSATIDTPTATGLSFSVMTAADGANNARAYAWSAIAGSGGSGVISANATAGKYCGIAVFVTRGDGGANSIVTIEGSSNKTFNVFPLSDSVILGALADWNAVNDVSVTPSPSTNGIVRVAESVAAHYTAFILSWTNQGSVAYGITDHTGTVDFSCALIALRPSSGYSISVAPGSYALSGQAATLLASNPELAVSSGAYAVTGSPVSLETIRDISPDTGSYLIGGTAATLKHGWMSSLDVGAYVLAGKSVVLDKPFVVFALTAGVYALTGTAVAASHGWSLVPAVGSYAISGQAVAFRQDKPLEIEGGAYDLSGSSIEFFAYASPGKVRAYAGRAYLVGVS